MFWLFYNEWLMMNERIRELAEQVGLLGPSSRIGNAHEAAEKFAELIVRECVDICEKGTATQTTSGGAAILIKQHFGFDHYRNN